MKLPTRIQIGPISYSVIEVRDLKGTNDEGQTVWSDGRYHRRACKIEVEENQNEQAKVPVLLHEIMHGILDQAGYSDHPEPIIDALSHGLTQVMRDNPDLIALTLGAPRSTAGDDKQE